MSSLNVTPPFKTATAKSGLEELKAAGQSGQALRFAFLFSACVNVLQLTAPLYMVQLYDRVLGSGSEPTLISLSLLMMAMFLCMGVLDHLRGRILARIGLAWQARLESRIGGAALDQLACDPRDARAHHALNDLEALARLWASPALVAAMDMPFTPLFLIGLFIFHPILGWFAVLAMMALLVITLAHHTLAKKQEAEAASAHRGAENYSFELRQNAGLIRALGLNQAALHHWQKLRLPAQKLALRLGDRSSAYAISTKTLRLFLQSAILGLGAWLALRGALAPSAMIAASILLGRALGPLEITTSQWGQLIQARLARKRLSQLLGENPLPSPRVQLPRPSAFLEIANVSFTPKGAEKPILQNISATLRAGQALGIIGPNGAGKSSLLAVLTGQFGLDDGIIRLGGADLAQFPPQTLAQFIGYMPQNTALFSHSIAENIARLQPIESPTPLLKAAHLADAHQMILRLTQGYDTKGATLSGGQSQRIALARALYGDPLLLLLDEPDANLDPDGVLALKLAIRATKAAGGLVVLSAHRPSLLAECDEIMVLNGGKMAAFGPKDQILRTSLQEGAA